MFHFCLLIEVEDIRMEELGTWKPRPRAHYGNDKSVFLSRAAMLSSVSVDSWKIVCVWLAFSNFPAKVAGHKRGGIRTEAKARLKGWVLRVEVGGLRAEGQRTCHSSFRLSVDIYDTQPGASEVANKCNLNWGITLVNTIISLWVFEWAGLLSANRADIFFLKTETCPTPMNNWVLWSI